MIFLIIFVLLVIPYTVNASVLFTFDQVVGGSKDINSIIVDYIDYDSYLSNTNLYNFSLVSNKITGSEISGFTKSGFLSLDEFKISEGIDSYLYDGQSYYTLPSGSTKYIISSTERALEGYTSYTSGNNGVRITNYVAPWTTVTGTGTYADPFIFVYKDEDKPVLSLSPQNDASVKRSIEVTVTADDGSKGSGIKPGQSVFYLWQSSATCPTNANNYTNSVALSNISRSEQMATASIVSPNNLNGDNYLCVWSGETKGIRDNFENYADPIKSGVFNFDNTGPQFSINNANNTTWTKTKNVIVTVSDTTGILASQKIKYGWSTSNTSAPSTFTEVTLTNSAGAKSTTFTAIGNNTLNGKLYLWVLPNNTVCDTLNNCTTNQTVSTVQYYFDNQAPRLNVFNASANYNIGMISANAVDELAGGNITYQYAFTTGSCTDSMSFSSSALAGGTQFTTSKSLSNASYNACLKVSDRLGNAATVATKSFRIYVVNYAYYSGKTYQVWSVPVTGTYRLEAWGGGRGNTGGYTSGNLYLTAGTPLYIYVGQESQYCEGGYGSCGWSPVFTAWNGGGSSNLVNDSYSSYALSCEGGSGATDFRVTPGAWNNTSSLRSRIMVAGGSSGLCGGYTSKGSAAGGLVGYRVDNSSQGVDGYGGSQNGGGSGYSYTQNGGFGYGGTGGGNITNVANCSEGIGGGGGYYGGGGGYSIGACCPTFCQSWSAGNWTQSSGFGAGGSSFISGHSGCDAVNESGGHTGSPNHYSGYVFTNTLMIDGNGYKWVGYGKTAQQMPLPGTNYTGKYTYYNGHIGNGAARVSFVSY